jgi:hypothetical protein
VSDRISVHSVVYRFDVHKTGNPRFRMDVFELPLIVAAGWLLILGLVLAVLLVASDADEAEERPPAGLGVPRGLS